MTMQKFWCHTPKIFIIIGCLIFTFVSGYATKQWMIKINDKVTISLDEFNQNYQSFFDYKLITSDGMDETKKKLNEFKQSKMIKKRYLQNFINEILIVQEAKKQKLYNESKITKKSQHIASFLKRQMIQQLYVQELSKKIDKIDQKLVDEIFSELSKKNKQFQQLSIKEKKEFAELQAKGTQIKQLFLENIEKLRNQNIIKMNDDVKL